jgi:hypothetical protein
MSIIFARYIQRIGPPELVFVPVGRCEDGKNRCSARDHLPGDDDVFARIPFSRNLDRTLIAQQFFYRGLDQGRTVAQQRHLIGMAQKRKSAISYEVHRRLVPCNQQEKHHCQQLVLI